MPAVVSTDIMVHKTMMIVMIRSGSTFRQLARRARPAWLPVKPFKECSLATD